MVTRADIQGALGRYVSSGQGQAEDLGSTCDYAAGSGQVTVTVRRLTEKLNMPLEIRSLIESIPESTAREAAGIGTRAFFLDIAGAGTQLHVLRGDHDYLMISVLGFGEAEQISAATEAIARKALGRF